MELSRTCLDVLKKRYFLKDADGSIIEDFPSLMRRVAKAIAKADRIYGSTDKDVRKSEELFYEILSTLKFLPNTPTLMNAGTQNGQLAACFVLPVQDTLKDIFDTLTKAAIIHQSGGGTGFSFSRLRPKGDLVKSTQGVSSGPVSFMKIYDVATEIIKQGGKRRGANMGVLSANHPDITEFISCKSDLNSFKNFNLSVAFDKDALDAVSNDGCISLINPRNNTIIKKLPAKELIELISEQAWLTGDPGIINLFSINNANPTPILGKIEATNPCGEQPLLPYESCTLGSINLTKFVHNKNIDYSELEKTVKIAVHFLDNVIEENNYPFAEIADISKRNRKIGLGVMGFADMLILLDIPYASLTALTIAEEIMSFINHKAIEASCELAKSRGPFIGFEHSIYAVKGEKPRRNATVTTIAPTGTISIIAGVSSGIEPNFAYVMKRNVMDTTFEEVHPIYAKFKKEGKEIKSEVFTTAFEVQPIKHLEIQLAFQKHTENAVSKTINLPENATINDVKEIFLTALEMGLKGVTVYRNNSKPAQTLTFCNINPDKEC